MSMIHIERAAIIERSRAFNAVVNLRTDLDEAKNRLAGFEAQGRHCRPEALKLATDRIAKLRTDLVSAEAYCREVNPDQLAAHDDDERRKQAVNEQALARALAEKEVALEANRRANAVLMAERLKDRERQHANQMALAAEAEAEAASLKQAGEDADERRRQIAANRLAHREAVLARRALVMD